MQHIFLVSSNSQHQALLNAAIDRENCLISGVAETTATLAVELQSRPVDLLILELEDNGETQLETVRRIMDINPLPVVMFVPQGDRESAAQATAAGVSAYVVKGLQKDRIAPILAAAVTRFRETQELRKELLQAKTSLQERKTIERAKGMLMEQRNCSENEAYTALRQLAMKTNKRLADVAQSVMDSFTLIRG